MKICFFNRSYWPDQAATGQLLTELAEDLVARHGCQVTVVAGRALHAARDGEPVAAGALVRRETHHGVDILRANGTRLRPARFAGARRELPELLRARRPRPASASAGPTSSCR